MSEFKLRLSPGQVRPFAMDERTTLDDLRTVGIDFGDSAIAEMGHGAYAMDAAPPAVTTPSTAFALQFLQYFFATPIEVVTQARVADELLGRTFAGSWYDQQIVMPVVERTGQAQPYTDAGNVPFASLNINYEPRTIVRMELGFRVGILESQRGAAQRIDITGFKRSAIANALAISANDIAFNGYNDGDGHTYGILNDPGLPAFVTVAANASSNTEWSQKTFSYIVADLQTAVQALRVSSGSNFDPTRDPFTLGVATSCREYLDTVTDFGISVMDYIRKTWPECRVVTVPQFDGANSGDNVFYLIADKIAQQKVADQYMQQAMFLVGITPNAKGPVEDYSNATAGTLVSLPIGVVRYSGI